MPKHYDDGEYRGSEHATDVFRAPPKEQTPGEKLQESGEYIDSGEGTDNEGNLLKSTAEGALWSLEKYGQGIDWTNDQVNLRNLLRMNPGSILGSALTGQDRFSADKTPDWLDNILDYSYKDLRDDAAGGFGNVVGAITGSEKANDAAELVGQILLPDAVDFATGGVGYLDNIARGVTKLRKLDGKTAAALVEDVFSKPRFKAIAEGAKESIYENARKVKDVVTAPIRTAKGLVGSDSIVANFGTGLDRTIRELPNTLDPRGLRNWGADKRKAGARFITGKTVQDEHSFIQAGWEVLTTLNRNFGIDINRGISPFQVHHKGVIRQIAESANGLTDEGAKLAGDYISKRVGFKMGYDATNAVPLPPKFHQRVHDIINDSISGRWGDNLEGLVQKLGLPPNWQTTMDLQARIDAGVYDEIADAINESTEAIDTFWKGVSTRTNLGKLSSDEFIDATFEVLKQDEILTNLRRTRSLSPEEGYNITQAVNELLERAGRIDLQSPIFDKLTPEMTKEAYKFAIQRNGWKALKEVLVTGQDPATIFKAYGIKTKGFEEVLTQLGIPGLGKSKELGTGSFLGRPKGSKTSKSKLQKQQKKKYDEDPDLNKGNTGRDETKPMDPPPDN